MNIKNAEYLSAYKLFKSVWETTFQEVLHKEQPMYSDDFLRQDYIQALFQNESCIALNCIRMLDLNSPVALEDSWLADWPRERLAALAEQSPFVLINSYFTVHPQYRKQTHAHEFPVSYGLGCLSVLHQLETQNTLMLGMMRNDRSMNKLGKAWGCTTYETVIHNDIPTDLVSFDLNQTQVVSKTFPLEVQQIFLQRNDNQTRGEYEKSARIA